MSNIILRPDSPQITVWLLRNACWPKKSCSHTFSIWVVYK